MVELKPISDEAFKFETLSELLDWDWIVDIVVSFNVVKIMLGELISYEDCSTVSRSELKPTSEDATKVEILPDGMVVLVVELSKELNPWSVVVIKAEIIELGLLSGEALEDEILPVLLAWDWIVEIVSCSNELKFGPGKEISVDDCSISFVLKMSLVKTIVSLIVLKLSLDAVRKTEALSDLADKDELRFWKELRLWYKVVFRAKLFELRSISDEAFMAETLSELLDCDLFV